MTKVISLEEKIIRHQLFWEGKADGRPLLGALVRPYIFPSMIKVGDGEPIYPKSLDIEAFMDFYEEQFVESQSLFSDLLYVATPVSGDPWGLPWMEAILGAPVRRSGQHAWAEAIIEDWELLDELGRIEENPWFQLLLELIVSLVQRADGRFPIGTCIMRGPADLSQALRGATQFGLDILDSPDEIKCLLDIITQAWVRVAQAQLELIPPFRGGYCSGLLPLWGPGSAVVTQEDANFFFSPARYKEMLLPVDLKIIRSFDYPLYHIHSGYTHTLDALISTPWRGAVDLSRDPTGPPLDELFPIIKSIQQSGKRVVFHGEFTSKELQQTIASLNPNGLCLMVVTETVEEANGLLGLFYTTENR